MREKFNKRKVGNYIEEHVASYLVSKGYEILGQNFFIWGGEIDIIAQIGNDIVFVEVKARTSETFITLEESITRSKTRSLIRACEYWLKKHHHENSDWRIDFVGVIYRDKEILEVRHYEAAIY